MHVIIGASTEASDRTCRLVFGPNAGRKALTLQGVSAGDDRAKSTDLVSRQAGFSMHAGVACKSNQRKKLEHLCRYITRSAIAEQRLSLASNGNVIVPLTTPYNDGTSHVVLSQKNIYLIRGSLAEIIEPNQVPVIIEPGHKQGAKRDQAISNAGPITRQQTMPPNLDSAINVVQGRQRRQHWEKQRKLQCRRQFIHKCYQAPTDPNSCNDNK